MQLLLTGEVSILFGTGLFRSIPLRYRYIYHHNDLEESDISLIHIYFGLRLYALMRSLIINREQGKTTFGVADSVTAARANCEIKAAHTAVHVCWRGDAKQHTCTSHFSN